MSHKMTKEQLKHSAKLLKSIYEQLPPDEPTEMAKKEIIAYAAEMLDAEEQGLLVRLPCKVGDVIYTTEALDESYSAGHIDVDARKVVSTNTSGTGFLFRMFSFDDFGKTVFLSREEAETALKEQV